MNCPYLNDDRCSLAELLVLQEIGVQVECPTSERRCEQCVARGKATADAPTSQVLANGLMACPAGKRGAWKAFCNFVATGKPRGLGDCIDKVTSATGIKWVVKSLLGSGCGCGKRRKDLNELFPAP